VYRDVQAMPGSYMVLLGAVTVSQGDFRYPL